MDVKFTTSFPCPRARSTNSIGDRLPSIQYAVTRLLKQDARLSGLENVMYQLRPIYGLAIIITYGVP